VACGMPTAIPAQRNRPNSCGQGGGSIGPAVFFCPSTGSRSRQKRSPGLNRASKEGKVGSAGAGGWGWGAGRAAPGPRAKRASPTPVPKNFRLEKPIQKKPRRPWATGAFRRHYQDARTLAAICDSYATEARFGTAAHARTPCTSLICRDGCSVAPASEEAPLGCLARPAC